MKKVFSTKLLACVAMMLCAAMSAPSLCARSLADSLITIKSQSNKIVFVDGKPHNSDEASRQVDSIRQLVSMFYYDQFRHFQDPDAPYFLFMSKDAGLAMGVGGGVRMRAYYDWGGAVPGSAFSPYTIPIPANPASMRRFATTPSGTYLFFKVIGRNRMIGDYQLYIEADFTGYQSRDFKLKKAYAQVNDFTFGYAASTFSDPAAVPAVVDAAGPNNKISHTSVLARYMPCLAKRWYVGASVETPGSSVDVSDKATSAISDWMPDFAALVQYEWARGQHVRLSGIVRTLGYRNISAGKTHNVAGWGLHLSSVAHPLPSLTTFVNANYGRGIAGLTADMAYGAYDLVPDPANAGRLYAPRSYGWNVGVQYNFTPMIFASVSASQNRYLPDGTMRPDEYKYGVFACANVFWNITPRILVAAEYDWGTRHNFSGAERCSNRANFMAAFTF